MGKHPALLRFALRSIPPVRQAARSFGTDAGGRLFLLTGGDACIRNALGHACEARVTEFTASGPTFVEQATAELRAASTDAAPSAGAAFRGILMAFIGRDVWWACAGEHAIWRLRAGTCQRLSRCLPGSAPVDGSPLGSGHAGVRPGDRLIVADRSFEPTDEWRRGRGAMSMATLAATTLAREFGEGRPASLAVVDVVRLPFPRLLLFVSIGLAAGALGLGGSWLALSVLVPTPGPLTPPHAERIEPPPTGRPSAHGRQLSLPLAPTATRRGPNPPRPGGAARRSAVYHNHQVLTRCPGARSELIAWLTRVRGEEISSPDDLADAIFAWQAAQGGATADGRVDGDLLSALGIECS